MTEGVPTAIDFQFAELDVFQDLANGTLLRTRDHTTSFHNSAVSNGAFERLNGALSCHRSHDRAPQLIVGATVSAI